MFDTHFEVFIADTTESKEIHYSIRYQVYCEEMGFENKDDFPEQMEYDDHDDSAIPFIVRSKVTGQWVGTMRLIFKKISSLPIEQNCEIHEEISSNDLFDAVELSRLCLIKDARNRLVDIDPPHGIRGDSHQPKESDKIKFISSQHKLNRMIIWGLFYAAAKYGYSNNIQYCYFMTTAILARLLRKAGLNLISIGEPGPHNGGRFPYKMNVRESYKNKMWQDTYSCNYGLFSELQNKLSYREASI